MKKIFSLILLLTASTLLFFGISWSKKNINDSTYQNTIESKTDKKENEREKEINFSNHSSNYYQENEPFLNSEEIGKDQYKDSKILICEFAVKPYFFEHESIKYVALIGETDFFTCIRYEKAKQLDNDIKEGYDYIYKMGKWTKDPYKLQRKNISWMYDETFEQKNIDETIDLMKKDIELFELNIDKSDTIEI